MKICPIRAAQVPNFLNYTPTNKSSDPAPNGKLRREKKQAEHGSIDNQPFDPRRIIYQRQSDEHREQCQHVTRHAEQGIGTGIASEIDQHEGRTIDSINARQSPPDENCSKNKQNREE